MKERIHPLFGFLRWEPDSGWSGTLPNTGAKLILHPEFETPDEFPDYWSKWLPHVDRDPSWITPEITGELKKLAGYGWPVLPFEPALGLVSFSPDRFTIYLDTPALDAPHSIEVHFNKRMKIRSAGLCG